MLLVLLLDLCSVAAHAAALSQQRVLASARPSHGARMVIGQSSKQASQIVVGDALPDLMVELVTDGCAQNDDCPVLGMADLLGVGTCVLVGMPGAFTPTCTDKHLPGYIRSADEFRRMGVGNVAVVTTNDRFVMTAWKRAMSKCLAEEGRQTLDGYVSMLADRDGKLIRSLGLAYELKFDSGAGAFFQLNAGIRSQRFALVADNGVVTHLAIDEGDTALDSTSAEAILAFLSSRRRVNEAEAVPQALGGLGLLATSAALAWWMLHEGHATIDWPFQA